MVSLSVLLPFRYFPVLTLDSVKRDSLVVVEVVEVEVVFTFKTVPVPAQYLLLSVLVQLTWTPSVVTRATPQKGVHLSRNQNTDKTSYMHFIF